jgi:hypothetical protein
MAVDKWSADEEGYKKQLEERYKSIDTELEEEEKNKEVPEELTRPIAEQLLTDKEKLLTNIYT